MNVKSMARVKYSYSLDGINLSGIANSNIVTTEIRKMSLLAKKFVSSEFFKAGDVMYYNIVLCNNGTSATHNVIINDDISNQELIPSTVKFCLLADDNKTEVNYAYDDNKLLIKIPTLEAQNICIISYKTVMGSNINMVKTSFALSSDEVEKTVTTPLELKQGFARIECSKKVNENYTYLNSNLTYELVLRNTGNISAFNVEVFDELPSTYELNPDNPVCYAGENVEYQYVNNILSFVIPEVPASAELVIEINGKIVN